MCKGKVCFGHELTAHRDFQSWIGFMLQPCHAAWAQMMVLWARPRQAASTSSVAILRTSELA
jgi:hypothetical protein